MYFWSEAVTEIAKTKITLSGGKKARFNKFLKPLLTSEPMGGSELQMKWATLVSKDIIDILFKYDVRVADIWLIFQLVEGSIQWKNEEALVEVFGKEKLETLAKVFWAWDVKGMESRNIRMRDIFI